MPIGAEVHGRHLIYLSFYRWYVYTQSFVEKFDRAARLVGWSSLACVGVWYALLLLLSLLGRTELPDQFWRAASSRHSEGEINAARSLTGLEFAFREAAPEMKSTIMSLWLITVAFGNLLVTVITRLLSADTGGRAASVSAERFLLYAGMTLVVAILFSVVAAFYRYRDCSAAEGK